MPGPHPGTFDRNKRCRQALNLSWSEFEVLVAVTAHLRIFDSPVTHEELTKFCLVNCETTNPEYPLWSLITKGMAERRTVGTRVGFAPTRRGSATLSAWRRGRPWKGRAQGAAE